MKRKVSVLSGVFLVTASLVSSAEGQPVLAVPGYIVELVASGGIAADGLTLGSDGYVYITDFNGASNGALMRVPQNATNSVFQTIASGLANPTDVARTPAGRLFVPESANGNLTEAFLDGTTSVLATGFPTATSIEYHGQRLGHNQQYARHDHDN